MFRGWGDNSVYKMLDMKACRAQVDSRNSGMHTKEVETGELDIGGQPAAAN